MKEYPDKYLYIRDIELFTILASFGINEWYGIKSEINLYNYSLRLKNEVIASLYEKGYIKAKEDKFLISDELSKIIRSLIDSKTYIYIRKLYSDSPIMQFYLSENEAVYVERSLNTNNTLKLSVIAKSDLRNIMLNSCFNDDIDDSETEATLSFSLSTLINEQKMVKDNLSVVIEKFSTGSAELISRIVVKDYGINYKLYVQEKSGDNCFCNTQENRKYIIDMLLNN